jgi:hypothetical protein
LIKGIINQYALPKKYWLAILVAVIGTLVVIGLAIPKTIKGDIEEATQISISPLDVLSDTPTIEEVKWAVNYVAEKYGLDKAKFYNTIKCESSFRYNAKNKHSTASGVAQFIDSTWKYCKGDKSSARDQLICMAEFWQKGEQHQWECYQLLYN